MSRTLRSDLRSLRSRWDSLPEVTRDLIVGLLAVPVLFALLGLSIAVLGA